MRALGKSEADIQTATASFVSNLSQQVNQNRDNSLAMVNVVDRFGTRPAQFLTGYFVDAPVSLVSGVLHPIQSYDSAVNTVAAYIEDPRAVSDSFIAQLQDAR